MIDNIYAINGINVESELVDILSDEIRREIDNDILRNVVNTATFINTERVHINANTRTLRARWSIDFENDLVGMYGLSLEYMFPSSNPAPIIPDNEYLI